jgi:hypothetical protein
MRRSLPAFDVNRVRAIRFAPPHATGARRLLRARGCTQATATKSSRRGAESSATPSSGGRPRPTRESTAGGAKRIALNRVIRHSPFYAQRTGRMKGLSGSAATATGREACAGGVVKAYRSDPGGAWQPGWRRCGPASGGEVEGEWRVGTRRRSGGCRLRRLGREADVVEDARHDDRVLDRGDEAQTAATRAGEDVERENPAEKLGPREIPSGWQCGAQYLRGGRGRCRNSQSSAVGVAALIRVTFS